MLTYILRRILQAVPVIIGTTFLTFVLLQVVPGDPIALMMREHIQPDVVERVRREMHLDDPWLQRYLRYMGGVLQGDFGESYKIRRDVGELLAQAFPATLALTPPRCSSPGASVSPQASSLRCAPIRAVTTWSPCWPCSAYPCRCSGPASSSSSCSATS